MPSESVPPTESPSLQLLLAAATELPAGHLKPVALPAPERNTLVVEESRGTGSLPLPYRARINDLLRSLIAREANTEAKEGEHHTAEVIERIKKDLRVHASTHPKLVPLIEILIGNLPSPGERFEQETRPVQA